MELIKEYEQPDVHLLMRRLDPIGYQELKLRFERIQAAVEGARDEQTTLVRVGMVAKKWLLELAAAQYEAEQTKEKEQGKERKGMRPYHDLATAAAYAQSNEENNESFAKNLLADEYTFILLDAQN